jgi:hypothetical protein
MFLVDNRLAAGCGALAEAGQGEGSSGEAFAEGKNRVAVGGGTFRDLAIHNATARNRVFRLHII